MARCAPRSASRDLRLTCEMAVLLCGQYRAHQRGRRPRQVGGHLGRFGRSRALCPWPAWSRPPGCPGRPPTAWPPPSRPTAWSGATARGRYRLGLRLLGWAGAVSAELGLVEAARPVLERLRDETGESAQLFVRDGDRRVCVAAVGAARRAARHRAGRGRAAPRPGLGRQGAAGLRRPTPARCVGRPGRTRGRPPPGLGGQRGRAGGGGGQRQRPGPRRGRARSGPPSA